MSRIILLGVLAMLATAGAATLAFRTTEPEMARPRAAADPLAWHLRNVRGVMALP
jgi:hypothetical protein